MRYRQAENLIFLKIEKENGLKIQMITEAGIIGKIGLNGYGVGCTLNAIRAKGVSFSKLPCHLALRKVLESRSRTEAMAKLEEFGVASACHILVADESGGTGLECSSMDVVKLEMDGRGVVAHTNHFVLGHVDGVVEKTGWLPDTGFRLKRVGNLLEGKEVNEKALWEVLKDGIEGEGASICRKAKGEGAIASLFGIVMDLKERKAQVLIGRPDDPAEKVVLSF